MIIILIKIEVGIIDENKSFALDDESEMYFDIALEYEKIAITDSKLVVGPNKL